MLQHGDARIGKRLAVDVRRGSRSVATRASSGFCLTAALLTNQVAFAAANELPRTIQGKELGEASRPSSEPATPNDVGATESNASNAPRTEGEGEVRPPSREIALRAGHVELEGPFNRLSLSQGVELTVYRYRVTAERLKLDRTPQGILVDGDGRLAFCPCAASPLTVGFSSGTVAPPTDLLLKNATFRACGIPVFWLPAFWIRSPNKVGLLTPTLAWRGAEGPWVGTGLHVPLQSKAGTGDSTADLLFGAYGRGGFDLGLQVRTPHAIGAARWDYFDRSLVEIDTTGRQPLSERSAFAWRIDALRGERGRVGPVTFEAGTRNYDRMRSELVFADGQSLYAIGMHWDTQRASAFREFGLFGPSLRWGVGTALGNSGRIDTSLLALGQIRNQESTNLLAQHSSDVEYDLRPGPFSMRWMAHERWLLGSGARSGYSAGLAGSELNVGVPMVRTFGRGRSGLVHWIEPFVLGTVAWRDTSDGPRRLEPGATSTVQFGVTNKIGDPKSTFAASLQVRAGSILRSESHSNAMAARWLMFGAWAAMGGDIARGAERQWLALVRGRLGRPDRIAIRATLEGRGDTEPTQVRWLTDEAWAPWQVGWFSRRGWLLRNDIDVGLGRQVAISSGIAYDPEHHSIVAKQASAAYRHPCGCLAIGSKVNWRAGRSGWDVLFGLDLMP